MARIKGGLNAKKRHNRTLKLAKGYRGETGGYYRNPVWFKKCTGRGDICSGNGKKGRSERNV